VDAVDAAVVLAVAAVVLAVAAVVPLVAAVVPLVAVVVGGIYQYFYSFLHQVCF